MRSGTAVVLILLAGSSVEAYNEGIHQLLPSRSFAAQAEFLAKPITAADAKAIEAFRRHLFDLFQSRSAAFRARYPQFEAFDAWELKSFLMLNPEAQVRGIDAVDPPTETRTRLSWWALASRLPDDDKRNQDRFRRDPKRDVMKDRWARPLPDDPATLEMGGLEGTESQAHAHYGLLPASERSSSPFVLLRDPRRFALPADAHTWSTEFAGLYTDLALLAREWGQAGSDYLEALFTGYAWHHIADVANQIHAVQIGVTHFVVMAARVAFWGKLLSQGGLLFRPESFREIGAGIVSNHHLVSEDLFAERILSPTGTDAEVFQGILSALTQDDAELASLLDKAVGGRDGLGETSFGRSVGDVIVDRSSYEGPAVYRCVLAAGSYRMYDVRDLYDASDDSNLWVRDDAAAKRDLLAMYELQGRGLKRAATALRFWRERFEATAAAFGSSSDFATRIANRFVSHLESYESGVEARRASWSPSPPPGQGVSWWWPIGTVAVLYVGSRWVRRWRRKRATVKGA